MKPELLTDPEINTVAILTRHDLHAGQVVRPCRQASMSSAKNRWRSMPSSWQRSRLPLEQSPGCLLTVGFNRRFAPLARRLCSVSR